MNRHRIKTTKRTGPDGGVRLTLTIDVDEFTLYAMASGKELNFQAIDKVTSPAFEDFGAAFRAAIVAAQEPD